MSDIAQHYADLIPHGDHAPRFRIGGKWGFLSRCMKNLHGFNASRTEDFRLAASPLIDEGRRHIEPGLRIFGKPEDLKAFLNSEGIQRLVDDGYVSSIPSIRRSPPHPRDYVAWIRSRSGEKRTIRYHERRRMREVRRHIARGGNSEGSPAEMRDRLGMSKMEPMTVGEIYLKMGSKSTGQKYSLAMFPMYGGNGNPSEKVGTFGLSTRENPVWLPVF